MEEWVYLNGSVVLYREALVPVEDRGNVFADGVYEVVRLYSGRALAMDAHMERLARSAAEIRLPAVDYGALAEASMSLADKNGIGDGTLYIQISRGAAPRNHTFPEGVSPTVFALARPLERPTPDKREAGVAAITLPDLRWSRCDIKSIALLPNVLASQQAKERGAAEALLVRDGVVTEGSKSNVFAVRGGKVITHPEGPHILPGITRRIICALAEREGIPCAFELLRLEDLSQVDELFISSTTAEVMPVTRVDGRPVGDGKVGPVTKRLMAQYDLMVEQVRRGDPNVPVK